MNTQWLSDQEQRTWRQWLRVNAMLPAAIGRGLASHGLSSQDYEVLVQLSEVDPARMRMSDLAAQAEWDRSRLSHHITRMERRGLVQRQACPEDRRGAFVAATDNGLRAIEAAAPTHVDSVRRLLFADLTPDELAVLDRVTGRLISRLEAQRDEG